jgi:hypothetical protein
MSIKLEIRKPRDVAVAALAISAALDLSRSLLGVVVGAESTASIPMSPLIVLAFSAVGVAFIGALALGLYTRFGRIFAAALALLTGASTWGLIALPGKFTFVSSLDVFLGSVAVGALILTVATPLRPLGPNATANQLPTPNATL